MNLGYSDLKRVLIESMKEHDLAKFQPDNPFTLSSGMQSPWYFDVKSALTLRKTRAIVVSLINSVIKQPYPDVSGGPANAAYLLVPLLHHPEHSFVMRKAEKGHGIVGKIDGWAPREGDSVVLVEDVITTGGSLLPCIKYVEERGAKLDQIIVVVDRNENDQLGKYRGLVDAVLTKEDFLP